MVIFVKKLYLCTASTSITGTKKEDCLGLLLWCPEPEASDRSGANGTCAVADRRGGNGITTRTVTGTKKEDRLGLLLFGARNRTCEGRPYCSFLVDIVYFNSFRNILIVVKMTNKSSKRWPKGGQPIISHFPTVLLPSSPSC